MNDFQLLDSYSTYLMEEYAKNMTMFQNMTEKYQ